MTKFDYLDEIKNLSKEEQRKVLVDYYNKYSAEKKLPQQITVCELLAEDFNYYVYKILLPNLYYENGEYEKVISYVDNWCKEIKNDEAETALILPEIMNWEACAYKKIKQVDKAIASAELVCTVSKQVIANMKRNIGENGNFSIQESPLTNALSLLGEIYFENGDYDKAGDYFIESREIGMTYKSGYYLGYFCLYGMGGARKNVQQAEYYFGFVSQSTANEILQDVSILSDELEIIAKACYQLGEIYSKEDGYKSKEKARQAYQKAKALGYNLSDDEISQKVDSITIPEKSNSKGCYVATCVYGSYDCPQVWTLRRFRDNILSNRILGRIFIKCYYAVSPTVVKRFGKYSWFNTIFKMPLDKLVEKLHKNGIEDTPYQD